MRNLPLATPSAASAIAMRANVVGFMPASFAAFTTSAYWPAIATFRLPRLFLVGVDLLMVVSRDGATIAQTRNLCKQLFTFYATFSCKPYEIKVFSSHYEPNRTNETGRFALDERKKHDETASSKRTRIVEELGNAIT